MSKTGCGKIDFSFTQAADGNEYVIEQPGGERNVPAGARNRASRRPGRGALKLIGSLNPSSNAETDQRYRCTPEKVEADLQGVAINRRQSLERGTELR